MVRTRAEEHEEHILHPDLQCMAWANKAVPAGSFSITPPGTPSKCSHRAQRAWLRCVILLIITTMEQEQLQVPRVRYMA